MDLTDTLNDLEKFGIDLKLESREKELFYSEALRSWFEEEKGYETIPKDDAEFDIIMDGEKIATIYIHDSVLRLRPLSEDPYNALMHMLEFISDCHKQTIAVFDYLSDNDDLSRKLRKSYKEEFGEEKPTTIVEEEAEEESDDDDWEWI
jgi:Mg2+ and Co2+ transporter CorA